MRVLLLSVDLFSYGGIQRYSRYLLQVLRRSPLVADVRVASLAARGDRGFAERIDVDVSGGGRGLAHKLLFALRVMRLAGSRRADVVICDHVYLAPIAYVYGVLTGTPYWLNVYAIEVWGELSFPRRRALLRAGRIVSDCEFTKRYLEGRYPSLAGRIDVVRDCVDTERFCPPTDADGHLTPAFGHPSPCSGEGLARERPAGPEQLERASAPDRRLILTLSRLAEGRSKGHEAVMRALGVLRGRGVEATYAIAGDGPDRHRLEGVARELGVGDSVVFRGAVADDELADVYRSADVFVLASAFRMGGTPQGEGVPLVTLEAQACGVPVITGRDDGSAESIVDGETGILIDPDDHVAIADALGRLLSDGALRARMGAAARALAVRQFSVEVFEQRIGDVISRFAGEGGDARLAAVAVEPRP
jgi:phosphatidylinositol alpha-1,6-mannosyltransferase